MARVRFDLDCEVRWTLERCFQQDDEYSEVQCPNVFYLNIVVEVV